MKKFLYLTAVNFVISAIVSIWPLIAFAQVQEASQEVVAGDITMEIFDDFTVGPIFFSPTAQTVQKIFALNTPGQQISVTDLRSSGDFSVDITLSDLESGTDVIGHEAIKILTYSESVDYTVDFFPENAPSDVTGPYNYNWDLYSPILESDFNDISDSGTTISDPINIIDGINPASPGRVGRYSVTPALLFSIPASSPDGIYSGNMTLTLNT